MMKSLLSQVFQQYHSLKEHHRFEINRNWLIFLFLTLFILFASSFIQRSIQYSQGRSAAFPGDFQVYYTAGVISYQDGDNRLYSYQEVFDENNLNKRKIINPQLDTADPNSTFAKASRNIFNKTESQDSIITQFLYPPFSALLFVPFTTVSFQKATIIWYLLTFILVWSSIFLTVKLIYPNNIVAFIISIFLTVIAETTFPMQDLLQSGNIGALILFLCVLGIFLQSKKYQVLSALFIAIAFSIKITPLIIILLMVIRRKWNWLIAFLGWSFLLLVISVWQLGWDNHQEFVEKIMPAMSSGIPERNNRSLISIFQFIELQKVNSIDMIDSDILSGKLNWAYKCVIAILFISLLIYLWKLEKSLGIINEMFLLLLLTLIVSPISWRHNYILAICPIIYLWIHPQIQKGKLINLMLLSLSTMGIYSILPEYVISASSNWILQLIMVSIMPISVLISIWLFLQLNKDKEYLLQQY